MTDAEKIIALSDIIIEIQWMALRYADGRKTYAVGMYNDAIKKAIDLGICFKPDPISGKIFAADGEESFEKEKHDG